MWKEQMKKIAVISDTHSLLRPEVEKILKGADYIIHAGDIADRATFDRISEIAPAWFVRGNADKEWAEHIPAELEADICGLRFYFVHNKKHIRKDLSGIDVVVFGHSHKYENRQEGSIRYLNPGSCGPRRFHQPVTMIVITVDDGKYDVELVDLSPTYKKGMKLPKKDLDQLIKGIIKDMDAGRTVEEIAKRNRTDTEFVNQILQIYTTHPGIDMDGILNRLPKDI